MQQPGDPAIEVGQEKVTVDDVVPAPTRERGDTANGGEVPPPAAGTQMTRDPGLVELGGQGAPWLQSQHLHAPPLQPVEAEGQLDALPLGTGAVQILGHEENRPARDCHSGSLPDSTPRPTPRPLRPRCWTDSAAGAERVRRERTERSTRTTGFLLLSNDSAAADFERGSQVLLREFPFLSGLGPCRGSAAPVIRATIS